MSATTFVRMPSAKQMAMMGIPDLPIEAFGGLSPIPRAMRNAGMTLHKSGGLAAVVGVVAAIAIPVAAPAIAGSLATSMGVTSATFGLSAEVGSALGSAIVGTGLGAVTAAATGQNVGRGALFGGIGGGIGGYMDAASTAAQASGTGSTSVTAAGTPNLATTPTANAVVTNVGSGTGYWSPELGAYIDPSTGNAIASQSIAYGGTVDSALASQLSAGAVDSQGLANAISANGSLAVNTPAAVGGNAAAFGVGGGTYYDPTTAVAGSSPAYAQAGLKVTPAMEQAAANAAVQSGQMTNVPATGPTTFSQALKQKFTDPKAQADMVLRAAGQLAGSAIAGDGLSDEEKALLQQQTAELQQLRTTNQELFNQRLQEAQNLLGESRYFDPEYFGGQSYKAYQNAAARAERDVLRNISPQRAGLRTAEERRFALQRSAGGQTAYLQGADMAEQNRIRTASAGINAMPTSGPTAALSYGNYIGQIYDAAERRRRQTAGDIGDLFGTFTGTPMANKA